MSLSRPFEMKTAVIAVALVTIQIIAASLILEGLSPIRTTQDRAFGHHMNSDSLILQSARQSAMQSKNVQLGTWTGGSVYCPVNGDLYVGEVTVPAIAVVNPINDSVVLSIKLVNYTGTGTTPFELIYDPFDGNIYAGIDGGVAVINVTTNQLLRSVQVPAGGNVLSLVVDQKTGDVLAGSPNYKQIVVFDPSLSEVVMNITTSQLITGLAFNNVSGTIFATGAYGALYELNAANYSFERNTTLGSAVYSLLYVQSRNMLLLGSGNSGVFVVNATSEEIEVTIPTILTPFIMSFDPADNVLYVSDGSNYSSDLECINISNQLNDFLIASHGMVAGIAFNVYLGQVYITGASDGLKILTAGGEAGIFTSNFLENGIASGHLWSVNVSGLLESTVAGDTMSFYLSPGSYNYAASSSGYSVIRRLGGGILSISSASENTVISFAGIPYEISFIEGGLPNGASWSMSVEGVFFHGQSGISIVNETNITSKTPVIAFDLVNGTYFYTVVSLSGWTANRTVGVINVTGHNLTISLLWKKVVPPFLYRNFWGLPVFVWLQFSEVAAIAGGTILISELVRKVSGRK